MSTRGADGKFVAGIQLTLMEQVTGPMKKILAIFPGLEKAGARASKAFKLAANMKQSADGIKGFGDGVIAGIGKPIKKMMEFEEIMSSVRANTFNGVLTAATKKEFEDLAATARDLGAKTKYSGIEAAEGMVLLATAGFDAKQQMAAMPGVLQLAAAANQSIDDSARIAAGAMAQFGLKAADMGIIGDVIVKTANTSQTGLLDIGEALNYAGVAAKNAGVSIQETTAMIGALGDAGVKGSAAGTTVRSILSSLQAPNKKGKSALDFLGIKTKDKAGNMRPIEELLSEMDKAMDKKFGKDKNGNRRAALLKGLFDEANAANASLLIAKAGSGDLSKKIAENTNAEGTAKLVADDMSNNTVGAAKELDSAYEELQLTIGSLLIPTMRDLLVWTKETTEGFTAWTKDNPVLTQVLGVTALAVGGASLALYGFVSAVGAAVAVSGAYHKVLSTFPGLGVAVVKAFNFMKLALLSNPITAIILGIAVAATLIYTYWDPIKSFFADLWEGVKATFSGVWDWILNKVEWLGGKVRWLKEELLGMRAGIDFSEMDKSLRDQVAKLSKADLEIAAKGTGKVAEAAQAKIRLDSLAASAPGLMADMKASAATAMSSIMPTGEGAANSLGAALTPAPLLPTQKGKPIMPTLPGSGSFRGELNIKVSGAQVDNAALKTSGDAGFVVRMNTGTQG